MNGTVILKVLAFLDLQKILGNFCFSEQIFHRKQSLGVPDFFYILNIDSHCMKESFRYWYMYRAMLSTFIKNQQKSFIHLTVYCYVTYVHIPRSSVQDRSNWKICSAALKMCL